MFCKKCGKESEGNQNFCMGCGAPISESNKSSDAISTSPPPKQKGSLTGKIIGIIVILGFIGLGVYNSIDEGAIEKNNEAMSSFDSGNGEQAIRQFQQASQESVTTENKLNTLKNLGYVYASENQYDQSVQAFREALAFTSEGSFDYYLVSGEIALLDGRPGVALVNYNKAYELSPDDYQINNALGLFYIDFEEVALSYTDYQKALKYIQKAYDVSTPDVKNIATENLAIAHFFNDNFDKSISLFSPRAQDPNIAYWLGWSYAMKDDVKNAKLYFQRAVDGGVEVEQEVYDYLNS